VGQRAHDDLLEVLRVVGLEGRGLRRRVAGDVLDEVHALLVGEEALAEAQLPEDDPEREDVRAAIERLTSALLRRHVGDLPLQRAHGVDLRLRGRLGDPEVDDLDGAVVADDDVRRRDVAVDDVERPAVGGLLLVRVVEAGGGVDDDVDQVLEREPGPGLVRRADQPPEVLPPDVLHGEEVGPVVLADVVDLDDVRVVERRREAGLAEEHLDQALVVGVLLEHALERDELLEAVDRDRPGDEQLRHPAGAEAVEELVLAEPNPL
jgi:hypothetical protein